MKFRKKPVVIDAVQWFKDGDHPNVVPIPPKVSDTLEERAMGWNPMQCRWIGTLEGGHIVAPGDWIITGVQGEQYPCKPDIFQATYEEAGAAPVPENWRSAVAMAYGHLWHINNEPMAPIPLRSEESASYAARKLLRDLLTTEERGEAINSVRAMLTAAPKDPIDGSS